MGFYPGKVKIVAHSEQDRTITVIDDNNRRHIFEFDINQNFESILWRVKNCIKGSFPNGAWAALRKGREIPSAIQPKIMTPGQYEGYVTDIKETSFGLLVNVKTRKVELMAKHDSKNYPDKEYRFTAIAPEARSLTYHGQRQWFKTKAACKAFCEDVFASEDPKKFVLAIVEAKELIEPKRKIETTSTILSK